VEIKALATIQKSVKTVHLLSAASPAASNPDKDGSVEDSDDCLLSLPVLGGSGKIVQNSSAVVSSPATDFRNFSDF
jgi:hypothetical protein